MTCMAVVECAGGSSVLMQVTRRVLLLQVLSSALYRKVRISHRSYRIDAYIRDEVDERGERDERDERGEVDERVVQQAVEMRSHATPKLGSVRLPLRPPSFHLASSPLSVEVNMMQLGKHI